MACTKFNARNSYFTIVILIANVLIATPYSGSTITVNVVVIRIKCNNFTINTAYVIA